jgi:hypothetical protein
MRPSNILERTRALLLREWDPIGVRDVPQAADEYDSYVDGVVQWLRSGATASAIADQLIEIEVSRMGLAGDRARAKRVAEALRRLK